MPQIVKVFAASLKEVVNYFLINSIKKIKITPPLD